MSGSDRLRRSRRAAISVPSNIAEGQGRLAKGEFRQFLGHARGSLFEVETQMYLAASMGFLEEVQPDEYFELSAEIARLLNGLITSLRQCRDWKLETGNSGARVSALFHVASAVAIAATLLAVTRAHPVHALLYLIVSLLGVAAVMLALGAPFAAMLEVMVYAGAIMVLFVFVVMLLNLGPGVAEQERQWLRPRYWIGPGLLAGALLLQLFGSLRADTALTATGEVGAKAVGILMFGPYLLAVELGSMLLLAGLVSAYHLGRREPARGGAA